MAPEDGYEITELIRLTKMTRATLYRRLREHARQGHAIQVSRGRWRGLTTGEPSP
jgi:DNA-binding IclR family transcriptional regulator